MVSHCYSTFSKAIRIHGREVSYSVIHLFKTLCTNEVQWPPHYSVHNLYTKKQNVVTVAKCCSFMHGNCRQLYTINKILTSWRCATSKKPVALQLQLPCNKRIDNLYFIINKLICNSLITLLCVAIFKQITLVHRSIFSTVL